MAVFDSTFYDTEKMRFDADLHDGKKRIVKSILPYLKGKTVLDFGCGSGLYTKMVAQHALKVYGVDNPIALSHAQLAENIVYTQTPPKTEVTLFFDCLEFIPNWSEVFERYRSSVNFIIYPNFSKRHSRIVSLLMRLTQTQKKKEVIDTIKKIEAGRYHTLYRVAFEKEWAEYVQDKKCKIIPFSLVQFPLSFLFGKKYHDHFLCILSD
ncbi:MAG: Methyltransferase domain [Candidatus Parcubacteria bacterium]|jgi:trans-aconitate methyltransferase